MFGEFYKAPLNGGGSSPLETSKREFDNLMQRIEYEAEMGSWAACTKTLSGSPLACRTGAVPRRCHDGLRACGTVEENTHMPSMTLDFHEYKPPNNGNSYIFAIHFRLPAQEEYAALLFHSLTGDVVQNRGWKIEVFDKHHDKLLVEPLTWDAGSNVAEYTEGLRDVTYHFLAPTANDGDYLEMSKARFVKISLIGEYRQFWIDQIDVYFRHIILDGPLPPPPPLPIASPLSPPAPPDPPVPPPLDDCTIFPNLAYREEQATLLWEVGCGVSRDDCCGHARHASNSGKSVNGFKLSAAGCCDMISISTLEEPTENFQFGKSATGVL